MANHFDLLDLADGESGAAAVSVLVSKKKAEAKAAREARKAARRRASAITEIMRRRADTADAEVQPAAEGEEEVIFTDLESAEIEEAVAAAEREADEMDEVEEEKEQRPKLCFYDINKKKHEKKEVIEEQIKLTKQQKKVLEEQISLLEKQRKMSEEQQDNYEAQTKLEEEQSKLKGEQRKLKEDLTKLWDRRNNLTAELGEYDVKGRAKDLREEQSNFKEDQNGHLKEERNFWVQQRRRGRWYGNYFGGNGSNHNDSGNSNGGYARGNGNGDQHNYNDSGNGGYSRGNGNGHQYNYNGNNGNGGRGYHVYNYNSGYGQDYYSYQQDEYGEFYHDGRQQGGFGLYYSGDKQEYRGGKAKRQIWQRRDKVAPDAGTDSEHKPEVVVSASETQQKVGAVNGDAVSASGSEKSTGDAANGVGVPLTKRFVPKVKLSGSQKRKQKKKDAVDGSSKNTGNETEKTKQNSAADVSKEQIATEPRSFEEEKNVTLDEFEKLREAKKSLQTTATVVRTVSAEEFKGLQLLEKKKADEEEAIKKAEKVKPKEKVNKVQSEVEEGAAKKTEKPDPQMVAGALFRHAPRPRRDQDVSSNRYYRSDYAPGHRENNSDYRSSGRGDYGIATQEAPGNNGNGAPRGGYSTSRRDGYRGRGNGGYRGGYGYNNRSDGNGFYQERAAGGYRQGGGYRGRGNGRYPQRGHSEEDRNRAKEVFINAEFPALSGTAAVAPAPASAPSPPAPASAPSPAMI